MLEVKARAGAREHTVRGTRLRGEEIRVVTTGLVGERAWNQVFRGTVKDDRIDGEVTISNGDNSRTLAWTATRTR
jgi:hypothetical protein